MTPVLPSGSRLGAALALALVAVLASGCFGVPPGTADTGDSVTIQYTAYDLESGALLRDNRTVSFSLGDGDSGLGTQLEGAVRGHREGDSFEVQVRDDPTLDYSGLVEVNRTLSPIPIEQTAPRADFEQYVGPPSVGQTFDAYGIYTGQVTFFDNETIEFKVLADDGQEDQVPSVGAVLVTHVTETQLLRELKPLVGATFTIPAQPNTPLGLSPGSYKTVGATETKLQFARNTTGQTDLSGKDLRIVVTVLHVIAIEAPVPTGGNYGVRGSSQVSGDPNSALTGSATA